MYLSEIDKNTRRDAWSHNNATDALFYTGV